MSHAQGFVQAQAFRFREYLLEITIKNIYFLISLSRRGAPISLVGGRRGGEMVKYYITTYYRPRSKPTRDGKIKIKDVTHFPLRTILFIVSTLPGISTLHAASRSYMQYDMECLEPTTFNQSEGLLVNMEEQLSKEGEGKLKNFGYNSILVPFALKRIPLLQPQQITLKPIDLRVPRMRRWIDHMS